MSYQNLGGYQNVPGDEQQAVPNDMTNPNLNPNPNPNPNQQQPPQTYHVAGGVPPIQQQSFQGGGGAPQPPGGARAYMPTYHEYMQHGQHNAYSNVPGPQSQQGFGNNYMGGTPYAQNWLQYSHLSKRRKIIIAVAISVFILFVIAHPSRRNVNSISTSADPSIRPGTTKTPTSDTDSSTSSSTSSSTGSSTGTGSESTQNKGVAGDGNHNNNGASNIPSESTQQNSNQNNDNGSSSGAADDTDDTDDNTATTNDNESTSKNNSKNNSKNKSGNNSGNNSSSKPNNLKIAYLLTYPMSGTTYTKYLIEKTTNTTLATNNVATAFLNDQGHPIRVFPNVATDGNSGSPLWTRDYSTTSTPQNFVLTLSHCTGFCFVPCQPDEYIQTLASFEESCRTIIDHKDETMDLEMKVTPKSEVAKVIHLIRDPFSNVVSRFHEHLNQAKLSSQKFPYTSDKAGFKAWCAAADEKTQEIESILISTEVRMLLKNVPCKSEFYKYVAWHNHVGEMIWNEGYDSIDIHYEDYDTEMKREADAVKIGEFLDWETVNLNDVPGHLIVRLYKDYYEEDEVKGVANFVKKMALKSTMKLLDRYFDEE